MKHREEILNYADNYLNDKYDQYCMEILSDINARSKSSTGIFYHNISFSSVFDEIMFVILYENDKYNLYLEEVVRKLIYNKLEELPQSEVDFLLIKCVDELDEVEKDNIPNKYYFIADEFIRLINQKVLSHLTCYSESHVELYLEKLRSDIAKFAFSGSFGSDDYNINNYWEEFCFQIQYGEDYVLDIVLEGIESHLYTILEKAMIKDVILLYIQTDEFKYEEYYIDDNKSTPSKEEMIDQIIPKLIEEIKYVASTTYVPDFSTGEDWDD